MGFFKMNIKLQPKQARVGAGQGGGEDWRLEYNDVARGQRPRLSRRRREGRALSPHLHMHVPYL